MNSELKTEVKKFDAEVGKTLNIMINSIYTNKEIFIRELISNSSDACEKLRFLALKDDSLRNFSSNFKIDVVLDKDNKTIPIIDNGIGMNRNELIQNLGTIANSGTQSFVEKLSEEHKKNSEAIGQFGVGFYSSFMVADKVTVHTKKAGEDNAYTWESDGKGEYSISDNNTKHNHGTEIILHIKDDESSYLDQYRLKHIIKTYSDHIAIPIYIEDLQDANLDDAKKGDSEENDKENEKEKKEPVSINSSSALWARSKDEITTEQYNEFYRSIAHAADEPWVILHNKNEGAIEFTNLLFVPKSKTFDLFHPDRKCRVKLYVKKIFIGDDNIDIIPKHLRFLRGIIDCADLPLNISRETLQNNSVLLKVKNVITNKVIAELKSKLLKSSEEYVNFWNNFGGAIKEGLCEMSEQNKKLLEICMFYSVKNDKLITLDQYISESKEDNKNIYYISGDNIEQLKMSPYIESLIDQGHDVLLFTDAVDDFWVNINHQYKDFSFKSATRTEEDANEKDTKKDDETDNAVIEYFKSCLGDLVKDVKISKKLKNSPVCLTADTGGMDMKMEKFLIDQKQLAKASPKIMEINLEHPIIQKISHIIDANNDEKENDKNKDLVNILYDQACLAAGMEINHLKSYITRINDLIVRNT